MTVEQMLGFPNLPCLSVIFFLCTQSFSVFMINLQN